MLQDKIDLYFKIPIFFSNNHKKLSDSIINDLEISTNKDPSKNYTLHDSFIKNKLTYKQLTSVYPTDPEFIKNNQNLIIDISNMNFTDNNITKEIVISKTRISCNILNISILLY